MAVAQAPVVDGREGAAVVEARRHFLDGAAMVKLGTWSEALIAFERSARLRPHAITTYNIAICQRGLGSYLLARRSLHQALADNVAAGGTQLPESLVAEIRGLLLESETLMARARVHLDPANAALAIDGRPLAVEPGTTTPVTLAAGLLAPGAGETPPAPEFTLLLDPGTHVITLSRKGYRDAVVRRDFPAGSDAPLALVLDRLPALLRISASLEGAAVTVGDSDVGLVPVDVSRPAGRYPVTVRKSGFIPYRARLDVEPGQELNLRAELVPETRSLSSQWWFWSAIGAASTVVAGVTYGAVVGSERPPLNGGGTGWLLKLP